MENKQTNHGQAAKTAVRLIVEREFVGDKNVVDTFIPIIVDDLYKKAEKIRTLDRPSNSD